MKNKREKLALSEIMGVVLLLGIAVSLFVLVQITIYSYPFEPAAPSVNIVGSISNGNILLEHHGGESLSLDTRIIITIDDVQEPEITVSGNLISSDGDAAWEIGEIVSYDPSPVNITNKQVIATVVDVKTDSIVMRGILQGGSN
jgi:hypothetical protein